METALAPATSAPAPLTAGAALAGLAGRSVASLLQAARAHLGMDIAFISEFRPDHTRCFRYVDSRPGVVAPLRPGDTLPLAEGYCQLIVEGRLPELIPDTAQVPAAQALPATRAVPIGAHLSVPLRLADGRLFGTFCCFSFRPDPSLNERDLGLMRTMAELVAQQLDHELAATRAHEARRARITAALTQGQPALVYQPIFHLGLDWGVCGVECLSRFTVEPPRGPDQWFDEAHEVGLGPALELAAVRRALAELATLPGDFSIAVNCAPVTLLSDGFEAALEGVAPERLVVEITEHARVHDYAPLAPRLEALRARGVRVAVDDAGAGYASLRHVLSLRPDFIKLDVSLTRGIDDDWMRYALTSALVEFARCTGSTVIAEGVESAGELAALHRLGVQRGQGYFLGRPQPLAALAALLREQGSRMV